MDKADVDDVVADSHSFAASEQQGFRHATLNPLFTPQPDPASRGKRISPVDLITLKNRFPHLEDFTDDFLMDRTTDELLRIESMSLKIRDAERSRDVEDRLHANKSALGTKLTIIPEGQDNRWTILHRARFLGGAACSAQVLWSTARAVNGINGHPPLSN